MKKKSISECAIIGFDHGHPCRVKNMALGPQLRQKPRPSASVFVYWVPRAMFFTRHGRPWSNPTPKSRPKGKSEPKHKTPKKSLTTTGKFKSKIQHLLNGKQEEWKPGKKKQHINKLTRKQASTIFKARTRMLNVKNNYRNNHQNTEYRMCKNAMETHTRGVPSNSLGKHTEKKVKYSTQTLAP